MSEELTVFSTTDRTSSPALTEKRRRRRRDKSELRDGKTEVRPESRERGGGQEGVQWGGREREREIWPCH